MRAGEWAFSLSVHEYIRKVSQSTFLRWKCKRKYQLLLTGKTFKRKAWTFRIENENRSRPLFSCAIQNHSSFIPQTPWTRTSANAPLYTRATEQQSILGRSRSWCRSEWWCKDVSVLGLIVSCLLLAVLWYITYGQVIGRAKVVYW